MKQSLPKIVVILGPTASGKTDLAIHLAKIFGGEVVSADSRQIYRFMNIATAKPPGEWVKKDDVYAYIVDGVRHHLMDIVNPDEPFTVVDFKARALEKIFEITKRGRVPLVVGGTGLYIWALIDNLLPPAIPPNPKMRAALEKKSTGELSALLKALSPLIWEKIDQANPRRLIRALEVALSGGPLGATLEPGHGSVLVETLQIGISWPPAELRNRIKRRINEQWRGGLLEEITMLHDASYDFDLPSLSGIGYKEADMYRRGELTAEEAKKKIEVATWRYAKRQLTWFKRDKRIVWLTGSDTDQAVRLVGEFLS